MTTSTDALKTSIAAALDEHGGSNGAAGSEPAFDAESGSNGATSLNLDTVMRIPVTVKVVLGSAVMPVSNLVKLGRGAIIPLDRRVGEPVDVVVNGRVVARGEVVVMDNDKTRFGLTLTEVVGPAMSEKAS